MNGISFLTPKMHGVLDYLAAIGLILIPILLGFEGLPFWVSVAAGAGLIIYSLMTDYALGIAPIVPFHLHLFLDLAAGATFIILPFLLGWNGIVLAYYLTMAFAVMGVVALSTSEDQPFLT